MFRWEKTGNPIDWSFINRDERLENGSIKKLIIKAKVPPGFFSNLAEIDTLCVSLSSRDFWFPANDWLKETKANCLRIECILGLGDHVNLLTVLRNGYIQKTFKVKTVECLVTEKGDYPVPQPMTFENDAEVWGKI